MIKEIAQSVAVIGLIMQMIGSVILLWVLWEVGIIQFVIKSILYIVFAA